MNNCRTMALIAFLCLSILPAGFAQETQAVATSQSQTEIRRWPQVRYRYVYPRNYRAYRPRVYYYPPAYRYPTYVYPRTPNMMYYGPAVRVYYGPWGYAY